MYIKWIVNRKTKKNVRKTLYKGGSRNQANYALPEQIIQKLIDKEHLIEVVQLLQDLSLEDITTVSIILTELKILRRIKDRASYPVPPPPENYRVPPYI